MPQTDFNWLLNPSAALPETDTAAAEAAVGMGGMTGSPFDMNNRMRLRMDERAKYFALGQNLLQPYLQRDFAAQQQTQQIAAQAASDALRESGAMARLSAEGQQRLQLALIQGDQQAADRLLTESGLDRRSAAGIAASLQERTMSNQNELLRTLIPYALPKGGAGGGGGAGAGMREGAGGTYFMGSSNMSGVGVGPNYNASREESWRSNPMNPAVGGVRAGGGSGISGKLGPVLDRLLRSYGLG